jgi:hypothetical protein
VIKAGQKIHASVAFKKGYRPAAVFSTECHATWDIIIGKGEKTTAWWANPLTSILELDLFDHSAIPDIVKKLGEEGSSQTKLELLCRLAFMADDGIFQYYRPLLSQAIDVIFRFQRRERGRSWMPTKIMLCLPGC